MKQASFHSLQVKLKAIKLSLINISISKCIIAKPSLIKLFSISFVLHLSISTSFSAENEQAQQQTIPQEVTTPVITWPVNLEKLSESNSGDQVLWLDIRNEKLLVLKYLARGKIYRGNILLMHAQGENADHPRITKPLAFQLSRLGWQVFVPTLPNADYPVTLYRSKTTAELSNNAQDINSEQTNAANNASSEVEMSNTNAFFPDTRSYQDFINQTILKSIEQITPKANNFIIIGNKNAAYWILESTKLQGELRQIVLIDPELPQMINSELKASFDDQFLPILTFMQKDVKPTVYTRAFDRKVWRTNFQRFNREIVSNSKIHIEDTRISKTITGWINSLKK